jgi:NADPH2:quinone reductase
MVALFGGASGQVEPLDLMRLSQLGSLFVTRPTLVHYTATREELLDRAADVFGQLTAGALQIEIGGHYDLDDAARAYHDLEGRRTTGKLILVP